MPTSMVTAAGIAPLTPLEYGVDATWRLDADDRRALRELSARLTGV
jgi:hypothetical protein